MDAQAGTAALVAASPAQRPPGRAPARRPPRVPAQRCRAPGRAAAGRVAPACAVAAGAAGWASASRRRGRGRARALRTGRGASLEEAVARAQWPPEWPYREEDFSRIDEGDDASFYDGPSFPFFMDGGARGALTEFYAEAFAEYPGARCLDVGAGRLSHYPQSRTWEHMSITGLMEFELQGNSQADDFAVRDLNKIPELPYCSASFDIVTCAAAFKYFVRPLEILREMGRVLKPGGVLILSTSNRMFEEKAVRCWRQTRDDVEHCLIYASFVHYSGLFERPLARDVTPLLAKVGIGDPMYVVFAKRSQ